MHSLMINERVREVLKQHARMPVDPSALGDGADLYDAGMTSHASVDVMLALEDAFDVEFPDAMLKRSIFASVDSICSAVALLERPAAA